MRSAILRRAAPLLLAGPLSACISFGAKPPASLLTITPAASVPLDRAQDSARTRSIVIEVPAVPQAISGVRVPVQVTPTSLVYVPDAAWSEPPARLFARLLSDTVTARNNMVVVTPIQAIGDPSAQLSGELRTFGVDATARMAIVTYDGALRRAGVEAIEKRRFEARVPIATIDAASAGTAINDAANQVAGQVADWIAR